MVHIDPAGSFGGCGFLIALAPSRQASRNQGAGRDGAVMLGLKTHVVLWTKKVRAQRQLGLALFGHLSKSASDVTADVMVCLYRASRQKIRPILACGHQNRTFKEN